jgi:hypothetical protein
VIADDVDHDRAFWGIGFPVQPFSADQAIVDIVEEYLKGNGNAVLKTGLEGLDQSAVAFAVVVKLDGKCIEHKIGFF